VPVVQDQHGQLVLNPEDARANPPAKKVRRDDVLPHVRKFGCIPDYEQLRAGDLVLVASLKGDIVGRTIQKVQTWLGFAVGDARWEHAAVYIGKGKICEAGRSGVRTIRMHDEYVGDHLLRFRRGRGIQLHEGYEVAIQALLFLRYSYHFGSVLNLLYQGLFGRSRLASRPRTLSDRATICSRLFADAFGSETRRTIDSDTSKAVTPAALSFHSDFLEDIPVEWVGLAE